MRSYCTIILCFGMLLLYLLGCNSSQVGSGYFTITCDAEKVVSTETGRKKYETGGLHFENGQTQTSEMVYSGSFACKLTPENPFGIGFMDTTAKPGDYYEITAWRNSQENTGLIVLTGDQDPVYVKAKSPIQQNEDGWELIQLETTLPPHFTGNSVKIYLWNPGETVVYFDDLKIIKTAEKEYDTYDDWQPALSIQIDPSGMAKLHSKRLDAFKRGTLQTGKQDWVTGTLTQDSVEIPVKLRLKGDWLDHLQGQKWSFRIKVQGENNWNRLREFSVQNARTRDYLNEWVLHQLLERENVLTTRYEFIPVMLNGKSLGIYVYEEHFEKQLLEYSKRREGPILKYSEDPFWDWMDYYKAGDSIFQYLPLFDATDIVPFNKKSTVRTPILFGQFKIGRNLMWQFKEGLAASAEIFDMDAMARYYALTTINSSFHGLVWHNLRFYINPVTCKLEPIVFDAYCDVPVGPDEFERIAGFNQSNDCEAPIRDKQEYMLLSLFNDSSFVTRYLRYLQKYSDKSYINSFMKSLEPAIKKLEHLLQTEYPAYRYNYNFLTDKARLIRKRLPELLARSCARPYVYKPSFIPPGPDFCHLEAPIKSMSVKAYIEEDVGDRKKLKVLNYHCQPVQVIGTGNKNQVIDRFKQPVILPAYQPLSLPTPVSVNSFGRCRNVFFSQPGSDNVFSAEIFPWGFPENTTPYQQLKPLTLVKNHPAYSVKDTEIHFKPAKHKISKDIVIPAGYRVTIGTGTQLDFINGARFISQSPVFIIGSVDQPVVIQSSDSSAGGFTVLNAGGRSKLDNVVFDCLNTLDYRGWKLTGAVTFYESDVDITNCRFINSMCEDALNIIRSDFVLTNCRVENSRFDGFDADFCTGAIRGLSVIRAGNDGMDFSGCSLKVENCALANIGDKGISVGEESTISINRVKVENAYIAISSKDLSCVQIEMAELANCQYGFAVFQKKAEYGPASIAVVKMKKSAIKTLYLLGQNSILRIGNSSWVGHHEINVEVLYN